MKVKTSKGITLIALVITIIVLLILAGVSIAMLTGDNGILTKSTEAKQTNEQKSAEEQVKLAIMGSYGQDGKIDLGELKDNLNKIPGITGVPDAITDFPIEVTVDGQKVEINKTGETVTAVAKTGTTPSTPQPGTVMEYAIQAMPSGASIKAGTTEETGIVMIDSKGNEWVWVEVPSTVFSVDTTATNHDAIKADLIAYATDYREGKTGQGCNWTDEWYSGCGIASPEEYTTKYQTMLSSIYENKGFYIARYEAGIEGSDTNISLARKERTAITSDSPEAVSKKDMIPYNYVYCSDAQQLASGMATGGKTSSLLFGIQWDLTCKFLEEKTDLTLADIKTNSEGWGNYSGKTFTINSANAKKYSTWGAISGEKTGNVLLTTGATEYTNRMNIYDFAGNELEWTLEKTTSTGYPCALRGGCYDDTGSNSPASYRYNYSTTLSHIYYSFRSSLY